MVYLPFIINSLILSTDRNPKSLCLPCQLPPNPARCLYCLSRQAVAAKFVKWAANYVVGCVARLRNAAEWCHSDVDGSKII